MPLPLLHRKVPPYQPQCAAIDHDLDEHRQQHVGKLAGQKRTWQEVQIHLEKNPLCGVFWRFLNRCYEMQSHEKDRYGRVAGSL